MNPAHVRKVAGSKPPQAAPAHTSGAPIAAARTVTGTAATPIGAAAVAPTGVAAGTPVAPSEPPAAPPVVASAVVPVEAVPEAAATREVPATPTGGPLAPSDPASSLPTAPDLLGRGSPELAPAVQDRLATWVCDLSLLHELTERLARVPELDDALREVLRAGATLVGAGRGLIALAPGDAADHGADLGTTVGLGLGHAELGALETVGFGGVSPDADEAVHPDLLLGPALDARQRQVAAQLGLGAGYGLALRVDGTLGEGTVSAQDPANSATYGVAVFGTYGAASTDSPAPPASPADPDSDAAPGTRAGTSADTSPADLCDFSTSGANPSATSAALSSGTDSVTAPSAAPPTGRRLGTAVWFYDEPVRPTARQRRLAGMYLRYAAAHLTRCLELARTRRAAAELTAELLPPRLPRVPGVRMAVRHRSGPRGGGDWYDALPLPEGALGLSVGGVTGAGPAAVAARDRLRASLRAYAVMEGEDPVAVLSDLELLLRLTEPARSATALFGHVCAPQVSGGRRVTLAGAGHCPPLLVGDHRCEYVETSLSAPLNMLACWEAPSVELRLRGGESLVLFTDGLPHRTGDSTDRAFARVHAAAQHASAAVRADPGRLADHLLEAVLPGGLDATGGAEDLVLLVVRFD